MSETYKHEFTYLIRAVETDRYKIGRSFEPRYRLSSLQTGCPFELKMLAVIAFPGAEEIMHRHYVNSRIKNAGGEWFVFNEEKAISHHFISFFPKSFIFESRDVPYIVFPTEPSFEELNALSDLRILPGVRRVERPGKIQPPIAKWVAETITADSDNRPAVEILTDKDLQNRYQVSPTTSWRLRKRKHNPLPHFFVGAQVRYRRAEVEAFFEERV